MKKQLINVLQKAKNNEHIDEAELLALMRKAEDSNTKEYDYELHFLMHWLIDQDIREKDLNYAKAQKKEIESLINRLVD